jgi:hypothetical protein
VIATSGTLGRLPQMKSFGRLAIFLRRKALRLTERFGFFDQTIHTINRFLFEHTSTGATSGMLDRLPQMKSF